MFKLVTARFGYESYFPDAEKGYKLSNIGHFFLRGSRYRLVVINITDHFSTY